MHIPGARFSEVRAGGVSIREVLDDVEDDGAHIAVTRCGRRHGSGTLCRSATSGAPRLAAGCPPPGPTTATPSRTTRAVVYANAVSAPLGIQDDALSGPTNILTLRALVLPDDGRALGC